MSKHIDFKKYNNYRAVLYYLFHETFTTLGVYLSWYDQEELEEMARKNQKYYDKIKQDILDFYTIYPDSKVANLSNFNLSESDLYHYFLEKNARRIYRKAKIKNLAHIFKFIYDRYLTNLSSTWLLCLIIPLSILGLYIGSQIAIFEAILLMIFFPISCCFSLVVVLSLVYCTLYAISFIYGLVIEYKQEKIDNEYYNTDITTQTIRVIRNLQYEHTKTALSIPLPRIKLHHLTSEREFYIPSDIQLTEDIAKELIAKINGSLYRRAITYRAYGPEVNKPLDIDQFILKRTPSVPALEMLGISMHDWYEMILDIISIGFIRGTSRSRDDFRCEFTSETRKRMLAGEDYYTKTCRHGLEYALTHFNIHKDAWIELGEQVLDKYKIFERNKLKELGYIAELPDHHREAYLELL